MTYHDKSGVGEKQKATVKTKGSFTTWLADTGEELQLQHGRVI